jgi:hypothetical protein
LHSLASLYLALCHLILCSIPLSTVVGCHSHSPTLRAIILTQGQHYCTSQFAILFTLIIFSTVE